MTHEEESLGDFNCRQGRKKTEVNQRRWTNAPGEKYHGGGKAKHQRKQSNEYPER